MGAARSRLVRTKELQARGFCARTPFPSVRKLRRIPAKALLWPMECTFERIHYSLDHRGLKSVLCWASIMGLPCT